MLLPYGRARLTTIAPDPEGTPVAARKAHRSRDRQKAILVTVLGEPRLRNLPVNRIPLPKNAVDGGQRDVLLLARGAERQRRARRLNPRRGVRPRRLETWDLERHAPHARRVRTHRQL